MINLSFRSNLLKLARLITEKVALASYELEDGKTLVVDELTGEASLDGESAPDGEYTTTAGEKIVVKDGKATVSGPDVTIVTEEPSGLQESALADKVETAVADEVADEQAPESMPAAAEEQALIAENEALKAQVAQLMDALTKADEELSKLREKEQAVQTELSAVRQELASQPAAGKINPYPTETKNRTLSKSQQAVERARQLRKN